MQLKYAAKRIGQMNESEITTWSKKLLLKIHVITGWVIPGSELMNILVDQFEKKLIEDYDNLNTEEIEYAFRKSGTRIKDWGKEMNLNLLDQVLIPYLDQRMQVSANEEARKVKPPPQKVYTDAEILNERRGHIETAYQAMRSGRLPIIHDYFAEVLLEDGFIQDKEGISQFFVDRLNGGIENIYVKA